MASLRVRCTSTVAVPTSAAAPLLSAFDAIFVSQRPLLHVYLFPPPAPTTPFPTLVESLKCSLAQTLTSYHPFAGELTYLSSSNSIAIIYTEDGAGVTFVEAETNLNIEGLLEVEELDNEVLKLLVPDTRRDMLPAPVLAVQITQAVGGVAVGVALHHAVADGSGLFHFMQSWTASAAQSCGSPHGTLPLPLHDRNLVRFDDDDEFYRAVLRCYGPNLPSVNNRSK